MTLSIGQVIEALDQADPSVYVWFEFGALAPTHVMSWRGVYAEAALGFAQEPPMPAGELLRILRESIDGREFTGYKGGEFSYTADTPLWVDNYGKCSNTGIKAVSVDEYSVMLKTEHDD